MLYRKSFYLFAAGGALLALLRVALKVLVVDTTTGFYAPGTEWLVWSFNGLLLLVVAGIAAAAWVVPEPESPIRGNRLLESASALYGVALTVTSLPGLLAALRMNGATPVINTFPRWALVLEHALGLAAGLSALALGLCLISGSSASLLLRGLALLPVLWQSANALDRFLSFRQVNTDSDQLIETLFMVSAILFLLAQARCFALTAQRRRPTVVAALLTALFGGVLVIGQGAALAVLGGEISGPSPLRLLLVAVTSVYAVCLALAASVPPRPQPAAPQAADPA